MRMGALRASHFLFCAPHNITILKRYRQADGLNPNWKDWTMNIARSFANWRKYRQTVVELDRMTNRELTDLGIARNDIHRVARQAVR